MTVEEAWQRVGNLDSQAFPASAADVQGGKLAALYTLQDGLPRNAENAHRIDHGNVSLGRLVHKKRAQFVGHADAPWSAWSELLAGDEAIVEPAMYRRGRDAKNLGGAINGGNLAGLLW